MLYYLSLIPSLFICTLFWRQSVTNFAQTILELAIFLPPPYRNVPPRLASNTGFLITVLRQNSLYQKPQVLLLRSSTEWIKATHIVQGNLLKSELVVWGGQKERVNEDEIGGYILYS
jgi:hypothetical protein